jgi:hypothetical protein
MPKKAVRRKTTPKQPETPPTVPKPTPSSVCVSVDPEAQKRVMEALKTLDKTYGAGTAMLMSETAIHKSIDSISTGSISLDTATGIGGVPRGRIVEVFGPESCLDQDTCVKYEVLSSGGTDNYFARSIKELYTHKLCQQ